MKALLLLLTCLFSFSASCTEDGEGPGVFGYAWYVNETDETLTLRTIEPEPFEDGYYVLFEREILAGDSTDIGLSSEAGLLLFSGKGDSLTLETPLMGCRAYSRQHTRAPSTPCCGEGPFRWDDYTRVSERKVNGSTEVVERLVINARTFLQGGPCP